MPVHAVNAELAHYPSFFWQEFLPNACRLILGFCLFIGGLWLSAAYDRSWRFSRFWFGFGAVLGLVGFLLLVGPIPWR